MPHSFHRTTKSKHGAEGAFGVRRLVAALEIVSWPGNGSLLPFSGETHAWLQAHRGHPGSKLPVWGSTRLLKAATSRRTPNVPWAPCVKNYTALGVPPANAPNITEEFFSEKAVGP
jgi:hypothetical protein